MTKGSFGSWYTLNGPTAKHTPWAGIASFCSKYAVFIFDPSISTYLNYEYLKFHFNNTCLIKSPVQMTIASACVVTSKLQVEKLLNVSRHGNHNRAPFVWLCVNIWGNWFSLYLTKNAPALGLISWKKILKIVFWSKCIKIFE